MMQAMKLRTALGLVLGSVVIASVAVYATPVKDTSPDAWASHERDLKLNYCDPLNANWDPYSKDSVDRGAPQSKEGRAKWKAVACTIDRASFTKHYAAENDENLPSGLCGSALVVINANMPGAGQDCRDLKDCYEDFRVHVKSIRCVYQKDTASITIAGGVMTTTVSAKALAGNEWVGRDFKKLFPSYKKWAEAHGQ
jgi:hypothetical protein